MAYVDGWMELEFGLGLGAIGSDGVEGKNKDLGLDHI